MITGIEETAWRATNVPDSFITIDLLAVHDIQSIAVQGHPSVLQNVISVNIKFQDAALQWSNPIQRSVFRRYNPPDDDDDDPPPYDPTSTVFLNFTTHRLAKAVRIYPLSYNFEPSMRLEIYGKVSGKLKTMKYFPIFVSQLQSQQLILSQIQKSMKRLMRNYLTNRLAMTTSTFS